MAEQCKSVDINGIKYVREDMVKTDGHLRIVILHRGWVFVGYYHTYPEGNALLTSAKCIRRWGTEKGLGELAEKGPLTDTKLDPCPTVRFSVSNVIATIDCVEASWVE